MSRTFLLGAMLLAMGLGSPRDAAATTLSPLTIEQMTVASDLIVRGVVTEVWTEKDAKGRIWTRAQVEINEVIKGDSATRAVIVDQLGGQLNNDLAVVHGAARFSVGEDAFLFLETLGSGHTVPVGMFQGKYTVRIDPDSGREMLVRWANPQGHAYDHRFIPHPAPDQRVFVDDLEDQVLTGIERGWDGQPIPGADPTRLSRINKLQPGVK